MLDVLDGYNGTIFAYGQTSSGKTHTMEVCVCTLYTGRVVHVVHVVHVVCVIGCFACAFCVSGCPGPPRASGDNSTDCTRYL